MCSTLYKALHHQMQFGVISRTLSLFAGGGGGLMFLQRVHLHQRNCSVRNASFMFQELKEIFLKRTTPSTHNQSTVETNTYTLMKHLEKKLDGNYMRCCMLLGTNLRSNPLQTSSCTATYLPSHKSSNEDDQNMLLVK